MARATLNYSALASSACTLELSEQQREGGSVREARIESDTFLKRHARQARLASALLFAAALAAVAVCGVGAAGGAWRRAIATRGLLRSNRTNGLTEAYAVGQCETPIEGSSCARDIEYAMTNIKKHPDWYVGLQPGDDPRAFQYLMHHQRVEGGKRRCPLPCHWNPAMQHHKEASIHGGCHTTVKGEDCYNHVQYTIKESLPKHPDYYPGLSQQASFKIVQQYLHHQGVCPTPCGLQAEKDKMRAREKSEEKDEKETLHGRPCHTAEAGETCYGDVLFAKKMLTDGTHDDWYGGKLNAQSSLTEIQAYLSSQHSNDLDKLCPVPCSEDAVKVLEERLNSDNAGTCHTAEEGSKCYEAVKWVVEVGIVKKPEWYKDDHISTDSTFEYVQNKLAAKEEDKDRECHSMACSCQTADAGDECGTAIKWVLEVGLVKHKEWYEDLGKNPTWEQIQKHLHGEAHSKCRSDPCMRPPWYKEAAK